MWNEENGTRNERATTRDGGSELHTICCFSLSSKVNLIHLEQQHNVARAMLYLCEMRRLTEFLSESKIGMELRKKQQQHTTAKEVGIRKRECFCCYLIISCDTWVNVKVIPHSRLCYVVLSYIVYRSRYYPPVSLFGSFFSPPSSTPHPHSAQAPPTESKLGIFSFIFKCELIKTRS